MPGQALTGSGVRLSIKPMATVSLGMAFLGVDAHSERSRFPRQALCVAKRVAEPNARPRSQEEGARRGDPTMRSKRRGPDRCPGSSVHYWAHQEGKTLDLVLPRLREAREGLSSATKSWRIDLSQYGRNSIWTL